MRKFTLKHRKNLSNAHLGKIPANKTHGLSNTRFFFIYGNLVRRCNSIKNNRYYRYGARGIQCEWKNFIEFRDDMYESYLLHCKQYGEDNTQIDRISNKGNYCKKNCRWATLVEQARNRGNTIIIKIDGEEKSLREWCLIYKKPYKTIYARVKYSKMKATDALIKKIGKKYFTN